MNCKYDLKGFSIIIVFFLATFTCYADIRPYFDYGELEMNFLIDKDIKVNAGIECFDFMYIEEKTGLYGAFCPINLEFKDIDKENELQKNPADICYFTLINANVGWIKALNDYFFLELPCVLLEREPRNEVNSKILNIIERIEPDVIYMPHFGDMQKDHLITAEAVMVAVRPKGKHIVRSVYSYEVLSETEWNTPHVSNVFIPNVFVDISDTLSDKINALNCYQSQVGDFPNPRSAIAVKALAEYRGSTMGAKAAEAFMLIREYRIYE